MTSAGSLDDRLHFVKHKGHAIFVFDFSHCKTEEVLLLLEFVRAQVARHPHGSLLTLADYTGAEINKWWLRASKKFLCSTVRS